MFPASSELACCRVDSHNSQHLIQRTNRRRRRARDGLSLWCKRQLHDTNISALTLRFRWDDSQHGTAPRHERCQDVSSTNDMVTFLGSPEIARGYTSDESALTLNTLVKARITGIASMKLLQRFARAVFSLELLRLKTSFEQLPHMRWHYARRLSCNKFAQLRFPVWMLHQDVLHCKYMLTRLGERLGMHALAQSVWLSVLQLRDGQHCQDSRCSTRLACKCVLQHNHEATPEPCMAAADKMVVRLSQILRMPRMIKKVRVKWDDRAPHRFIAPNFLSNKPRKDLHDNKVRKSRKFFHLRLEAASTSIGMGTG